MHYFCYVVFTMAQFYLEYKRRALSIGKWKCMTLGRLTEGTQGCPGPKCQVSLARGTRGCPGLEENLFLFADALKHYYIKAVDNATQTNNTTFLKTKFVTAF
jgi:hypothetical protein